MSDELQLQFDVNQPPASVMEAWRRDPPASLKEDGYELVDESFNSLTWEARYMDWPRRSSSSARSASRSSSRAS